MSLQSPCCGKFRGPRGAYFPIHSTSRQFIDVLFSREGGIGNCTPNGWVQWVLLTVLDIIHSRSRKKMLILTVTLSRLSVFLRLFAFLIAVFASFLLLCIHLSLLSRSKLSKSAIQTMQAVMLGSNNLFNWKSLFKFS